MLIKLKANIPEIFLGALLACAIFGMGMMYGSSQHTPSQQQHQTENSEAKPQSSQQHGPQWWGHSDPGVTGATVLLFAVGIAQAIMFYVQLRYMRDGMRDAKIAADAAAKGASAAELTAQAALDAQRAHLYVIIKETNICDLFQMGTHYDNSPTMNPTRVDQPVLQYAFRNYGKSPAILTDVAHGVEIEGEVSGIRTYVYEPRALEILGEGADSDSINISFHQKALTFGDLRSLVTEDTFLRFFGEANFVDTFGNEWVLQWEFVAMHTGWHQTKHGENPSKKKTEPQSPIPQIVT